MGIYGAINAAVSGLSAQSHAMENISGNVSNSQTIGYKRLDTTFYDLVSGGGSKQSYQVSGTSFAASLATNSVSGGISEGQSDTSMAIDGDGYFVVSKASNYTDGSLSFDDDSFYTRAGDFEVSKDGHLVNGAGYYLRGLPLDEETGNPVGNEPSVIQIDTQPMPGRVTTTVDYRARLPLIPKTDNYDGSDIDTALLDAGVTGDVDETERSAFLASSISGGSVTIYTENGTAVPLSIRFAKTANRTTVGPVTTTDEWQMYIGNNLSDPASVGTHYHHVGGVSFFGDGSVQSITWGTVGQHVGFDGFLIYPMAIGDNSELMPPFEFLFGDDLFPTAIPDGGMSSIAFEQDGYASGEFSGIEIDKAGRVIAGYSNGRTRSVYEIPLATFEADQNLKRMDGAAFAATHGSGEADLSGGGRVLSNAVELSNADIADEFSKLIITQQAYSANSRIVTSADEMLDSALNMVR